MGLMMILVAKLEGLDGVESVEPSNYGIVLEVTDTDALDEWLEESDYMLHDDVREYKSELLASNGSIPFSSPNKLVRMTRTPAEGADE